MLYKFDTRAYVHSVARQRDLHIYRYITRADGSVRVVVQGTIDQALSLMKGLHAYDSDHPLPDIKVDYDTHV